MTGDSSGYTLPTSTLVVLVDNVVIAVVARHPSNANGIGFDQSLAESNATALAKGAVAHLKALR